MSDSETEELFTLVISGVTFWVKMLNLCVKVARPAGANMRGERTKMAAVFTHFLPQK